MKVTSGVETDWQKPGYHSATEEDKIAPLYIMTLHFLAYIRQKRSHCIQCFVYVCLTSQDFCKAEVC